MGALAALPYPSLGLPAGALADRWKGLTQRTLTEKCGIKQPMINRIERGSQTPKAVTLLRILRALNGTLTMSPEGNICVSPAELAPWVTQPNDGEAEASTSTC